MTKSRLKKASSEHAPATRRPARTGRAWSELAGVAVGSSQWEAARLPGLPWRELDAERREIATYLNIQRWFDLLPRVGAEPVALPTIERDGAVLLRGTLTRKEQAQFIDAALRCRKAATAAFAFSMRRPSAVKLRAAIMDCVSWRSGQLQEARLHQQDCRDRHGQVVNHDMAACIDRRNGHRIYQQDISTWIYWGGLRLADLCIREEASGDARLVYSEASPTDGEGYFSKVAANYDRMAELFRDLARVTGGPRTSGRKKKTATRDLLRWAKGKMTQHELAEYIAEDSRSRELNLDVNAAAHGFDLSSRGDRVSYVMQHFTNVRTTRR